MAFSFKYNESTLKSGLEKMSDKMGALILMYSATKASRLQAQMKSNRPWTDRTGRAKATLSAKVSQPSADIIRITLAHGVWYGIYLELCHGKRYAIIAPTVRQEAPKMISDLQDIMNKIKL